MSRGGDWGWAHLVELNEACMVPFAGLAVNSIAALPAPTRADARLHRHLIGVVLKVMREMSLRGGVVCITCITYVPCVSRAYHAYHVRIMRITFVPRVSRTFHAYHVRITRITFVPRVSRTFYAYHVRIMCVVYVPIAPSSGISIPSSRGSSTGRDPRPPRAHSRPS